MESLENFAELITGTWFVFFVILIVIWDFIWKLIGMWRSAGNKQLAWFLIIAIFNTMGILPIVYLLWFQDKKQS